VGRDEAGRSAGQGPEGVEVNGAETATSPTARARTIGVFYLLTVVLGVLAQGFVADRLVVSGDAAATAANIVSGEAMFRLGFTLYLVELACQITMTVLFFDLLEPVGRRVALVATALGLTGCAVKIVSRLFYLAPVFVLGGGAESFGAFEPGQLQALSLLFLEVNDRGAGIAVVFFGLHALLTGWLVFRSTFLPRALGVLSVLGGLAWLTFAWPPLGDRLLGVTLSIAIPGALAMIGWLLVFGVDEGRWRERARVAWADRS